MIKEIESRKYFAKVPVDSRQVCNNVNDIEFPYDGLLTFEKESKKVKYMVDGLFKILSSGIYYNLRDNININADGITDDSAEIQKVINDISSNGGGTLIFPRMNTNVYYLSTVQVSSNIRITSESGVTIKLKDSPYLFEIQGRDIIIDNIKIDCSELNTNGDNGIKGSIIVNRTNAGKISGNILIEHCHFTNIPLFADDKGNILQNTHAMLFNCKDNIVRNNIIDQCGGDAINFNSGYNLAAGNIINNTYDGGIAYNNGAYGIICENTLNNCNLGVGSGHVANKDDTDTEKYKLIVANNTFVNCNWGINFGWFGYNNKLAPRNFIISNNTFKNSVKYDFRYDGDNSSNKARCLLCNNTSYGINTDNNDGATNFFIINGGNLNIVNNMISGQTNSSIGIVVKNSDRCIISNNNIEGATTGIEVADCMYSICTSNVIESGDVGITSTDTSRGRARYISIENNNIYNMNSKGIRVINSATLYSVCNNIIHMIDNTKVGIDLVGVSKKFICENNTLWQGKLTLNSGAADNYSISNNKLFNGTLGDGGSGSNKRVFNNMIFNTGDIYTPFKDEITSYVNFPQTSTNSNPTT